jgi:hypothetical protein
VGTRTEAETWLDDITNRIITHLTTFAANYSTQEAAEPAHTVRSKYLHQLTGLYAQEVINDPSKDHFVVIHRFKDVPSATVKIIYSNSFAVKPTDYLVTVYDTTIMPANGTLYRIPFKDNSQAILFAQEFLIAARKRLKP